MKTEMDALGMDERQRLAWLLANRATLLLVGVVWLGMIGWELVQHRTPYFMLAMVPAFALTRLMTYRLYLRTG